MFNGIYQICPGISYKYWIFGITTTLVWVYFHTKCMCRIIANACYRPKAYDMWWHLFHSDGLIDCMDPDCCTQSSCVTNPLCRGSRDPLQVIQQSQSEVQKVPSFYDRIKMLVGKDSTHIILGINPFNARYLICPVLWWTKLLNLSCSNVVFLCVCAAWHL